MGITILYVYYLILALMEILMNQKYKIVCIIFVLMFVTSKAYSVISNMNTSYYQIVFSGQTQLPDKTPVNHYIPACLIDRGSILNGADGAARYFLEVTDEQKLPSDDLAVVLVDDKKQCAESKDDTHVMILYANGDTGANASFYKNIRGLVNVGQ